MTKLSSSETRRATKQSVVGKKAVEELAEKLGIRFDERTIEWLNKYQFTTNTTVREFNGEIHIHTYDGIWHTDLYIDKDGKSTAGFGNGF